MKELVKAITLDYYYSVNNHYHVHCSSIAVKSHKYKLMGPFFIPSTDFHEWDIII